MAKTMTKTAEMLNEMVGETMEWQEHQPGRFSAWCLNLANAKHAARLLRARQLEADTSVDAQGRAYVWVTVPA